MELKNPFRKTVEFRDVPRHLRTDGFLTQTRSFAESGGRRHPSPHHTKATGRLLDVGVGHGGLGLLRIFSMRKTFRLHQSSCVKLVADETDYVLSGLREIDICVSLKH